jgi:capsular polysaccharide biosynthesis protein
MLRPSLTNGGVSDVHTHALELSKGSKECSRFFVFSTSEISDDKVVELMNQGSSAQKMSASMKLYGSIESRILNRSVPKADDSESAETASNPEPESSISNIDAASGDGAVWSFYPNSMQVTVVVSTNFNIAIVHIHNQQKNSENADKILF